VSEEIRMKIRSEHVYKGSNNYICRLLLCLLQNMIGIRVRSSATYFTANHKKLRITNRTMDLSIGRNLSPIS
jgi:hypothetical protein